MVFRGFSGQIRANRAGQGRNRLVLRRNRPNLVGFPDKSVLTPPKQVGSPENTRKCDTVSHLSISSSAAILPVVSTSTGNLFSTRKPFFFNKGTFFQQGNLRSHVAWSVRMVPRAVPRPTRATTPTCPLPRSRCSSSMSIRRRWQLSKTWPKRSTSSPWGNASRVTNRWCFRQGPRTSISIATFAPRLHPARDSVF